MLLSQPVPSGLRHWAPVNETLSDMLRWSAPLPFGVLLLKSLSATRTPLAYSVPLITPSTSGWTCPSCHSGPLLCRGIQIRKGSAACAGRGVKARVKSRAAVPPRKDVFRKVER